MERVRVRDDPWRRLAWVVPVALALTVSSQMGFLWLLERPGPTPSPSPIVSVQVVEVPAPVHEPPKPAEPRPKPVPVPRERPPEPPPLPKAEPPPPPPSAEPAPERRPVPAPMVAPDIPKDLSALTAPTIPEPSPIIAVNPRTPARTETRTHQGPAVAAVPPQPPVSGTPDGTGLGGGKMGARAIYKPLPEIPEALRRRNIEMTAVARFQVAATGVAQVELIEPTSDPDLNRVLLESLKRWRFFPGMENGKPIGSTVEIRIPISVR